MAKRLLEFNLNDAGETMAFVRNALHHVATTLVDRVRATQFRSILSIDNSPVPWQMGIQRDFVSMSAEWQWTQRLSQDVPAAEAQTSQGTSPLVAAESGYSYNNLELQRNAEMAIPLPQSRATAVRNKAETFLEGVAAFGGGLTNLGFVLKGLYNVVAHDGTNPTAADATAGGTITGAWSSASAAQIFADFLFLEDLAMTKSKDLYAPDTIVLPRSASLPFRSKNNTNTDAVISELCLQAANSIRRVVYWFQGNASKTGLSGGGPGVSNATRTIVANFRNQDVLRMVIAEEPGPQGEAFQERQGFYQPFRLVTGGVLSDVPGAVVTADGI